MSRWPAQALLDLGDGRAKVKRLPPIQEAVVSKGVKQLLAIHPEVKLWLRVNAGRGWFVRNAIMQGVFDAHGGEAAFAARFGPPQWIELGPEGMSDYIAMLRGGRFAAFEVKAGRYSPGDVDEEQRRLLARVNDGGGIGVVVSDTARLHEILSGRAEPVPHPKAGFLV